MASRCKVLYSTVPHFTATIDIVQEALPTLVSQLNYPLNHGTESVLESPPPSLTALSLPLETGPLVEALPLEILLDSVDLDQAIQHLKRPRHVHIAGPVDRPPC